MAKRRLIKRRTYRNLIIVANKIHREKGYSMEEAIRLAELKFADFNPKGKSIEAMVDDMLTAQEYEMQEKGIFIETGKDLNDLTFDEDGENIRPYEDDMYYITTDDGHEPSGGYRTYLEAVDAASSKID